MNENTRNMNENSRGPNDRGRGSHDNARKWKRKNQNFTGSSRSGILRGRNANNNGTSNSSNSSNAGENHEEYTVETGPDAPAPLDLTQLKATKVQELLKIAESMGVDTAKGQKKQNLLFTILQKQAQKRGIIYAEGTLERMADGYGFLRSAEENYLHGPDDIYVSSQHIRSMGLRTGDTLYGQIRPPKETERFFALMSVLKINGMTPQEAGHRIVFDNLTPLYPDSRLIMEYEPLLLDTRIIDLFVPIGKGQRALIVAPPRTGKNNFAEKYCQCDYCQSS